MAHFDQCSHFTFVASTAADLGQFQCSGAAVFGPSVQARSAKAFQHESLCERRPGIPPLLRRSQPE